MTNYDNYQDMPTRAPRGPHPLVIASILLLMFSTAVVTWKLVSVHYRLVNSIVTTETKVDLFECRTELFKCQDDYHRVAQDWERMRATCEDADDGGPTR